MREVFSACGEDMTVERMLKKHFRSKTFNPFQATEMVRDEYLDKYFKDTYIEWGTRWYLEKLHTRTATNAKILMTKLAKDGMLADQGKGEGYGVSLIDRIVAQKLQER